MDENMNENMSENTAETIDNTAEKKEETVTVSISDYELIQKKKKKNKNKKNRILFSFFGILLGLGIIFAFIAYILSFEIYWNSFVEEGTLPLFYLSFITLFFVLSVISFIISFLLFAKATKTKRTLRLIVLLCLITFVLIYLALLVGSSIFESNLDIERIEKEIEIAKQKEIEKQKLKEQEEYRNTLKYTDVSILDLNEDIRRYPFKYDGATVVVEGYASGCGLDKCYISFPSIDDKGYYRIDAYYEPQVDNSLILNGDYVVATAIVDVYSTQSGFDWYLIFTSYQVVTDPNDPNAREIPTISDISDNSEEELKSSSFLYL